MYGLKPVPFKEWVLTQTLQPLLGRIVAKKKHRG